MSLGGLYIVFSNIVDVPEGLLFIVHNAFTPTAAAGGFAGSAVWIGIQSGVARGIFSNEAGLGCAPIAHAAAQTHDPVRQGMIAMLGTFIDTIVVCTITALVIVTVHVPVVGPDGAPIMMAAWESGKTGADLSMLAFSGGVAGGQWIVMFGSIIFAYTTILGWSYYGERAAEYLFGDENRYALPLSVGDLRVHRFGDRTEDDHHRRRHHERADGDPESDRAAAAQRHDLQADLRLEDCDQRRSGSPRAASRGMI